MRLDAEDKNMLMLRSPYYYHKSASHALYTNSMASRREPEVKMVVTFVASHVELGVHYAAASMRFSSKQRCFLLRGAEAYSPAPQLGNVRAS